MALSATAAYTASRAQEQPPPQLSAPGSALSAASVSTSTAGVSASRAAEPAHTPTALSRWSLLHHQLPAADSVKSIHVYDFDNTLFKTPQPNSKLWNTASLSYLWSEDLLAGGGWWHDARILAATGAGADAEAPRAWAGWWNEHVVELARLSAAEPGTLSVLLTGRGERAYGPLLLRMLRSKQLAFDLVVLKPAAGPASERFASTMAFKQAFLAALLRTYPAAAAAAVRIYEDRPRHVDAFRAFLANFSSSPSSSSSSSRAAAGEVVHVAEAPTALDPVVEVAVVQHMINSHNAALAATSGGAPSGARSSRGSAAGRLVLTKTVFFTGYLVAEADTQRLLGLMDLLLPPPPGPGGGAPRRDLKYHGNSIMICPRACPPHLLAKVGGLGSKMTWRVEAVGALDSHSVYAAKVRPAPPASAAASADAPLPSYHTADAVPLVVLAVGRGARPHEAGRIRTWQPVPADRVFAFETTVGEKAVLRIEPEHAAAAAAGGDDSEYSSSTGRPALPPHKRMRPGPGAPGGHGYYYQAAAGGAGAGAAPTHPTAFAAPRGPSGGGRGYHYPFAAGRGGRGGGGRGSYRGGGGAALRGRGGGGLSNPYYQSLDDAGPGGTAIPARPPIVYDEA